MGKPRVYVTRQIPPPATEKISSVCEVVVRKRQEPPSKRELIRNLPKFDAVICLLTDRFDEQVLTAAPALRVISTMSAGFDHIDVKKATENGIYVTNTPGVLTDATADFAWTLLMAAARRIGEAERYVRGRKWRIGWSPTLLLSGAIHGKTLGILGLGRIGAAVAERAKGFNMRVIYHDAERSSPERERALGVQFVELEELLRAADFVSLHTPLTPETRNLINEDRLRMMKDTSVLINTSRGPIVDEKALAKALRQSWIAAAGLDVYEKEPISPKSPLLRLQNVVLAPHIASATRESRSKMSEIAAANLLALLRGERPPHFVNPEVQQVRPLSEIRML